MSSDGNAKQDGQHTACGAEKIDEDMLHQSNTSEGERAPALSPKGNL